VRAIAAARVQQVSLSNIRVGGPFGSAPTAQAEWNTMCTDKACPPPVALRLNVPWFTAFLLLKDPPNHSVSLPANTGTLASDGPTIPVTLPWSSKVRLDGVGADDSVAGGAAARRWQVVAQFG
jgi:hypothetical protein